MKLNSTTRNNIQGEVKCRNYLSRSFLSSLRDSGAHPHNTFLATKRIYYQMASHICWWEERKKIEMSSHEAHKIQHPSTLNHHQCLWGKNVSSSSWFILNSRTHFSFHKNFRLSTQLSFSNWSLCVHSIKKQPKRKWKSHRINMEIYF